MKVSQDFVPAGGKGLQAIPVNVRSIVMSARGWHPPESNIICPCFIRKPIPCLITLPMMRWLSWMKISGKQWRDSGKTLKTGMNSAGTILKDHYCLQVNYI